MTDRLTVLLTNITLASRTGTEIIARDVARGLLARGHTPIVYSTSHGEIAEEIRGSTIPVVADLANVRATPDVIHGHHHPETMTALLQFPGVPAVFFHRGVDPHYHQPTDLPSNVTPRHLEEAARLAVGLIQEVAQLRSGHPARVATEI